MHRYWKVRYEHGDIINEVLGPIEFDNPPYFNDNGFTSFGNGIFIIDLHHKHFKEGNRFVSEAIEQYIIKNKLKEFLDEFLRD